MTQANQFADLMLQVWDSPITETATGIHIGLHQYYDYYHNAIKTAKMQGAFKRWANKVAGMPGSTFEFSDGSRVNIAKDGTAFTLVTRHRD